MEGYCVADHFYQHNKLYISTKMVYQYMYGEV